MSDSMPLYLQIRKDVSESVTSGLLPVGSVLPTENDLAEKYGTTRLTVRKAIDGLEADGMVRRIQGKGSFVTGSRDSLNESPAGFRELTKRQNSNPSVRILSSCMRPAGPYYGRLFGISPEEQCLSLRRLNSADGAPTSLEEVVARGDLFPGIDEVDFSVFSLYAYYGVHGHSIARAEEGIDVVPISARDGCLLGLSEGDAVLFLECRSYDAQGLLIESALSYNVGYLGVYTMFN